jgi:hypothetical protein
MTGQAVTSKGIYHGKRIVQKTMFCCCRSNWLFPPANTAMATLLPSIIVFFLSVWQAFVGFMKPKSASLSVGAKPSVSTI